jgi:branched-chain amino acid transport system permease protein
MQAQQPAAYIGGLKAMAERLDSSELLPHFKFPVSIIHGEADELIPIDRAHEMKSAIHQAHFVGLLNVGHLPMLEAVSETANALKYLA